ncbi:MAG: hypothetical protein ISS16_03265 [Ignavibacteria bacterium]|nr:hypothetical protein [Ignavibacteria bacterium]
MKTPSDDLYQLVNSLTKDEKIYFKKYASTNIKAGDKSYVKLFDSIINMEEYDDTLLKEEFRGEKLINHFWKTKNYLYKIILRSLQNFHSEKMIELRINNAHNNMILLFNRGLYKQCRKVLDKGKKMCYDYEMYGSLLKILSFERKLMTTSRLSDIKKEDIKKHYDEVNKTTDKIKIWNEYQYNSTRLFDLIKKKGFVKNINDLQDLKEIIEQPLYKNINNAYSFETKLSFYNAHYFYNYLARDYDSCLQYSKKMIELFESSSIKMKSRYDTYIKIITNYLEVCLLTSNFESFKSYFKVLKLLSPGLKNSNIFIVTVNLELEYYIKSGEYETGLKFINQILPFLDNFKGEANEMRKCSFYYNVAYLYFLKNNFSVSLFYLNKILNNEKIKDELEVFYYARLLNLLIHYELGNYKLLKYILKSTYRFLSKRQRVFKTEKLIYYFIRSSFRLGSDDELNYSFYKLRHKLEEISSDPFERGALGYIDLISWLESKITNRHFSDLVKEKLKPVLQIEKEVTPHQAKLPL